MVVILSSDRDGRRIETQALVTNYGEGGGAVKREGGNKRSFTPTKRGGTKRLSHAEGGGGGWRTKSSEVVLTWELEVTYHQLGWRKKLPPFERVGGAKSFTVS